MMTKILLLTDSRGVHKPAGSTHVVYSERLAKVPGLSVTAYLCPYQWTTIPDLLAIIERHGAANYDYVVLHAGIVDHSPRPLRQMLDKLYDPSETTPEAEAEALLEQRKFGAKKIVNRKKPVLDALFGEAAMREHLTRPFEVEYEGERTVNLYSMEMLEASLLPRLAAIPNLVYVSSNDIVPGWNGDFPRQRPANIAVIEAYSRALSKALPNAINLHQWTQDQVREYTCDNMHLTAAGSDWIFRAVLEAVGMRQEAHFRESLQFRGEWVDDVIFALLAREWADIAEKGAGVAASR